MLFKIIFLLVLSNLWEFINAGNATVFVELTAFDLNSQKSPFQCYMPDPYYKDSSNCDVDITVLACSVSGSVIEFYNSILSNYSMDYKNRYTNNGYESFNADVETSFKTVDPNKIQCYSGNDYNRTFYKKNSMDTKGNEYIIGLKFEAKPWFQNIIVWLGAVTRDEFSTHEPFTVWFAELFFNEIFIGNGTSNYSYFNFEKNTLKFGVINRVFQFYPITTMLTMRMKYICHPDHYGATCFFHCVENTTHTCDKETGYEICKPGWVAYPYEILLNGQKTMIPTCNTTDFCYTMQCAPYQCILDLTSNRGVCLIVGPDIYPPSTCIFQGHVRYCQLPRSDATKNFIGITTWFAEELDDGVTINKDKIKFDKPLIHSKSYECTFLLVDWLFLQYARKSFSFMVMGSGMTFQLSIIGNVIVLGENINCITTNWNPLLVDCKLISETDNLILINNGNNSFKVSPKSKIGSGQIHAIANFNNSCGEVWDTLDLTARVRIKAFGNFDWSREGENVFMKGVDTDMFDCETFPVIPTNVLTVYRLEEPPNNNLTGFDKDDLMPGAYYIACELNLVEADLADVIYKYMHINYIPTNESLFVYVNETKFDSFVKCLPLPYPEEDFYYQISFFNGNTNRLKLGYVDAHSVSPIPFNIRAGVPTLIECKLTSKENSTYVVVAYNVVTFKGWKRPLILRYWRSRIWSQVFFAATLLMFVIIPLTWIIHIKSTGSISANFLTRRTLVVTNLKRRNTSFFNIFLSWIDNVNSIIVEAGTNGMSTEEAKNVVKANEEIAKDLYLFVNKRTIRYNLEKLMDKKDLIINTLKSVRKRR